MPQAGSFCRELRAAFLNPESRIPNPESRIPNPESRIRDAQCARHRD
ncbi:Av71 muscle cell intermediate filament [Xanthomonas campestris pv. campestris]|nr:Av71 muscle cell intermediate filament [Xanthomonas campestris pv. campestris]